MTYNTPKIQRLGRAVILSILYPYFFDTDSAAAFVLCGLQRIGLIGNQGVIHNIYRRLLTPTEYPYQNGSTREDGR